MVENRVVTGLRSSLLFAGPGMEIFVTLHLQSLLVKDCAERILSSVDRRCLEGPLLVDRVIF